MENIFNTLNEIILDQEIKEKLIKALKQGSPSEIELMQNMLDTLKTYNVGDETYASACLYVLYDKSEIDYEKIKICYGKNVEEILKNLYTASFRTQKNNEEEIENVRNMLLVMAKDLRVLIVLLSFVLYFAENVKKIELEHADVFMRSVQDIYAPLSARLGLNVIKNRLEGAGFKYLHPDIYERLSNEEILNKDIREQQVQLAMQRIKDAMGDTACVVMGRQKQLASIFNKMKSKNLNLGQLYDLMAVRVIVDSVEECYIALGKINSTFKIIPDRFKDYIANPKPNGYQSIHTCIMSNNNRPIEVQIRTHDMHQFAEYGVAAHWIYKENKKANTFDIKINWLKKLIEESDTLSSKEFLENVKMDMFADEIYAQTPNGKIIKFPLGANCIDFAYAIHSDIGNKCIGAKINGKIVPLGRELENGDECEIITSKTAKGPSRDWLKIVKTREARNKINSYFKKEFVLENIKKGKTIFNYVCRERSLQPADLLDDDALNGVLSRYSLASVDEMYASIGHGSLTAEQIINKISAMSKINEHKIMQSEIKKSSSPILVDQQQDMLTRFAKCCTPIPGDDIVGFISRGRGVTVHRRDCVNVRHLDKNRLIEVAWGDNKNAASFTAKLKTSFTSETNIIKNIIQFMDENKIKIVSLDSKTLARDKVEVLVGININSNKQLDFIMQKMHSLPNIENIARAN